MNFRKLEAFRAVLTEGSVTRAGQAMHITQPAVSRLIADLEAELGVALFERDRGRLKPTSEAMLLQQEADLAFSGLERLWEAAKAVRGLRRGRLRVISETVYAEGFLPRLAAAYHADHPDVAIELDIGPSARVADWVAMTWYDLGIVVLPVSQPDLSIRPLQKQNAICALPSDHRLSAKQTLAPSDLRNERFVSLVAGTPFRLVIDRAFEAATVQRDIRLEVRTQHALCAFVAAGAGVTIVDPCLADDIDSADIVFRPVEPEIAWEIAIVLPRARPPSLICSDFVSFLERQVALPSALACRPTRRSSRSDDRSAT